MRAVVLSRFSFLKLSWCALCILLTQLVAATTPAPTKSDDKGSTESSTTIVIAFIVAAVVLAAVIALACWCNKKAKDSNEDSHAVITPVAAPPLPPTPPPFVPVPFRVAPHGGVVEKIGVAMDTVTGAFSLHGGKTSRHSVLHASGVSIVVIGRDVDFDSMQFISTTPTSSSSGRAGSSGYHGIRDPMLHLVLDKALWITETGDDPTLKAAVRNAAEIEVVRVEGPGMGSPPPKRSSGASAVKVKVVLHSCGERLPSRTTLQSLYPTGSVESRTMQLPDGAQDILLVKDGNQQHLFVDFDGRTERTVKNNAAVKLYVNGHVINLSVPSVTCTAGAVLADALSAAIDDTEEQRHGAKVKVAFKDGQLQRVVTSLASRSTTEEASSMQAQRTVLSKSSEYIETRVARMPIFADHPAREMCPADATAYTLRFAMGGLDANAREKLVADAAWGTEDGTGGIMLVQKGLAAQATVVVRLTGPDNQRVRAETQLQAHNVGEEGAPVAVRFFDGSSAAGSGGNGKTEVALQFWPGQVEDNGPLHLPLEHV